MLLLAPVVLVADVLADAGVGAFVALDGTAVVVPLVGALDGASVSAAELTVVVVSPSKMCT